MKRVGSIFLCMMLFLCCIAIPVFATEPGELTGSTVPTYPDELPIFFNETGINITSQPKDVYAADGVTVSFSVVATGDITSYQWQYRLPTDNVWRDCTSATVGYNTSTISVDMSSARSGRSYRCIISNSLGYVVSNVATMYLGNPPVSDNSFTFQEVLGLFDSAGSAVVSWFSHIMDTTGAGKLYIAMMSVVLSVAILLGPLLGSARAGLSDVVHRPRQKKIKEDE